MAVEEKKQEQPKDKEQEQAQAGASDSADGVASVITKVDKAKNKKEKFGSGVGRRKVSTARAWVFKGKGEILVNDMPIDQYFPGETAQITYLKPFHSVGISHPKAHYGASVKVSGGGKTGQLEAVQLALTKALLDLDESLRPQLAKFSLLTTDSRVVERKKYFLRKARRRPQYSKR